MIPLTYDTRKRTGRGEFSFIRNRLKHVFMLAFICIQSIAIHAQCVSTAPTNANSFSNDNAEGSIPFLDPGYAHLSDVNRSIASSSISMPPGTTNYLKATDFNFSIPANAVICGVYALIQKSATGVDESTFVYDEQVKLVKGGVIVGVNAARPEKWPDTDTYFTYGNDNDLWSTTILPSDVNSPDFGIIISASMRSSGPLLPSARINHIQIIISYTVQLLPVHLVSFDAVKKDRLAHLKWSVAGEEDLTKYVIEQSADQRSWLPVYETKPVYAAGIADYNAVLPLPAGKTIFYRLRMNTRDGGSKYSDIKSITGDSGGPYSVFIDRSARRIRIGNVDHPVEALIINMQGMHVSKTRLSPATPNHIDITALPPGLYVLRVENFSYKFTL